MRKSFRIFISRRLSYQKKLKTVQSIQMLLIACWMEITKGIRLRWTCGADASTWLLIRIWYNATVIECNTRMETTCFLFIKYLCSVFVAGIRDSTYIYRSVYMAKCWIVCACNIQYISLDRYVIGIVIATTQTHQDSNGVFWLLRIWRLLHIGMPNGILFVCIYRYKFHPHAVSLVYVRT